MVLICTVPPLEALIAVPGNFSSLIIIHFVLIADTNSIQIRFNHQVILVAEVWVQSVGFGGLSSLPVHKTVDVLKEMFL